MTALLETSAADAPLAATAEYEQATMPKLHCLVQRGDTIKADLIAAMPAAIIAGDRLYYFEVAATSDSTAHAIAGALSESRVDAQWQLKGGPFSADWKAVNVGGHVTIRDTRLEVPNYKGRLHHVAAFDTSGELIVADSEQTLWAKLRARMSCPSLESWGETVMQRILRSKLLTPTQSYGMGDELNAYILSPDAEQIFDQIIATYVRQTGSIQAREWISIKEAA